MRARRGPAAAPAAAAAAAAAAGPRGVRVSVLDALREGVVGGARARGVELCVARRALAGGRVGPGETFVRVAGRRGRPARGAEEEEEEEFFDFSPEVDAVEKPRAAWTTEDVIRHVVLAETEGAGSGDGEFRYIDSLDADDVGLPYQGTFVVHAHKSKFSDLVGALQDLEGDDAPYVWIDMLCASRQWLEGAARREDFLAAGLHETMAKFDYVGVVLDRWDVPSPMGRLWCLWELFGNHSAKKKTARALYTPGQLETFADKLVTNPHAAKVAAIDARVATCARSSDLKSLHQVILEADGIPNLSEAATRQARNWLEALAVQAVRNEADAQRSVNLLVGTGTLFAAHRRLKEALRYLEEALETSLATYGATHRETAKVLREIGVVHAQRLDTDAALENLERAREIFARCRTLPHDRDVAETERFIGCALYEKGEYEDALVAFRSALTACHERKIDLLVAIGRVYGEQGRLEEALTSYEEALESVRRRSGPEHVRVATLQCAIGTVLSKNKEPSKAAERFAAALSIRRAALAPWDPDVAATVFAFAAALWAQDLRDEALRAYSALIESVASAVLEPSDGIVPHTIRECGQHCLWNGRHDEALRFYEQALALIPASRAEEVTTTVLAIAAVKHAQGRHQEALEAYESLARQQAESNDEGRGLAATLVQIGEACVSHNRLDDASRFLKRALTLQRQSSLEAASNSARALGDLCEKQNNFDEALAFYSEALEMHKRGAGAEDPRILLAIASLHRSQERYEEALEVYQNVLRMYKRNCTGAHLLQQATPLLYAIADMHEALGRFAETIATYNELAALTRTVCGERAAEVGNTLHGLGWQCANNLHYDEALSYLEEALSIREELFGTQSSPATFTLDVMAKVFTAQSAWAQASQCYERALTHWSQLRGPRDGIVAGTLRRLGNVYIAQERWQEASGHLARAKDIGLELYGTAGHPFVSGVQEELERCHQGC